MGNDYPKKHVNLVKPVVFSDIGTTCRTLFDGFNRPHEVRFFNFMLKNPMFYHQSGKASLFSNGGIDSRNLGR